MNYEKAYYILFNAITDIIYKYEKVAFISANEKDTIEILKNVQRRTEDLYIETEQAEEYPDKKCTTNSIKHDDLNN